MLKKLVSFSVALISMSGLAFGAASVRAMNPSSTGSGGTVTRAGTLRTGGTATIAKNSGGTTRTAVSTSSASADSGRLSSLQVAGNKVVKPGLPLSASASALEALEKRVDQLTGNVDDLGSQYNNLSADLSETQGTVGEHTGKFVEVESNISDLSTTLGGKADTETVEATYAKKTALADLATSGTVSALSERVSGAESSIETMNTNLAAKADADTVESTYAKKTDLNNLATSGTVTALSERISGAESSIETINTSLATKADADTVESTYAKKTALANYTPTADLNFLCDNPEFTAEKITGQNKAKVVVKCSGNQKAEFEVPVGSDELCKPTVTGPESFDNAAGAFNTYKIGNTCDSNTVDVTIRNGTAGESCQSQVTTVKCGPIASGYEIECEDETRTGQRISKTDCNNANPIYSYVYDACQTAFRATKVDGKTKVYAKNVCTNEEEELAEIDDGASGASGVDGKSCVNTRTVAGSVAVWKKCCTPATGGTETCTEYDSEKNAALEAQWQELQGTLTGVYTMPADYNTDTKRASAKGWTNYVWNGVNFRIEDNCGLSSSIERTNVNVVSSLHDVAINGEQMMQCRFPGVYMANMTNQGLAGTIYTIGTGIPVMCVTEHTKYIAPTGLQDGYYSVRGYTEVTRLDVCDKTAQSIVENKYDHCELIDIDRKTDETNDADGILECVRGDKTEDTPAAYYRMRKVNSEVAKKFKAVKKVADGADSKAVAAQSDATSALGLASDAAGAAASATEKAITAKNIADAAKATADAASEAACVGGQFEGALNEADNSIEFTCVISE